MRAMRCPAAELSLSLPKIEWPAGRPCRALAPASYVRISVADTGTGIAPEHLEQVLEPFFTTKEIGKGSGLGLPMVYGFAKQSNGAFRIESSPNKGTTAELWLPRAEASDMPVRDESACGEKPR